MYVIIWEYVPKAGLEEKFERVYETDGTWGSFFKLSKDYKGTELLRDLSTGRYWTIDQWTSREAYQRFMTTHQQLYDKIDHGCAELMESEKEVGHFEVVA